MMSKRLIFECFTKREILTPFLFNFDITHAKRVAAHNTKISAYLLTPDQALKTSFGFDDEMLLVISDFGKLQARSIQIIESVFGIAPFKGRADPLTYFFVSQDPKVDDWTASYLVQHPQARTPITLNWKDAQSSQTDNWYIRNKLSTRLFSRDIFDYQLPLDEDIFFFGRTNLISDFLDSIRKGQNRELFGLRKTGKTSFLFKLERSCTDTGIGRTVYIDCKRPDVRSMEWRQLLTHITERVLEVINANFKPKSSEEVSRFIEVLRQVKAGHNLCLIFDEIEYISPLSKLDRHWHTNFLPFWQTLWSAQSEVRKVSFVIAGVNPYLCELDLIDDVQNPMFGIVKPSFLTGLDVNETRQMLNVIGKRMGLIFADDAIVYLHLRYGGHPLLTRLACSFTNQSQSKTGIGRPLRISKSILLDEEILREAELYFYCKHVISVLQLFYKDEYEILEYLASGNIVDFMDFAADPAWIRHLYSYGIVAKAANGRPSFQIPVIQRFVASEKARSSGTNELRETIPLEKRQDWLSHRRSNIVSDMKLLIRQMHERGKWSPYGSPYMIEADLVATLEVSSNWSTFSYFINNMNKSLVEPIDICHGRNAFYGDLKSHYPELFDALNRIRLLRNNADHLRLVQKVEDGLKHYINKDLFGVSQSAISEPWFLWQQVVLDELLSAIQFELAGII